MSKSKAAIIASLDAFTRGYIECMLWSSTDESNEQGGEPLDANYDEDDLTVDSLRDIVSVCQDFQQAQAALLEAAYKPKEWIAEKQQFDKPDYDAAHAGHDFWLTRNGHGAGFWDRGLAQGDALTKAAKVYGECHPMVHRRKIIVQ